MMKRVSATIVMGYLLIVSRLSLVSLSVSSTTLATGSGANGNSHRQAY